MMESDSKPNLAHADYYFNRELSWVCVNLFYAKFRNLTCTAYLEMF